MATLLSPDGTRRDIAPADLAEGFALKELYALLDCETVETIALAEGGWLVVDEDGKGRALTINTEATKLFHQAGGMPQDYVVGPALVCTRSEIQ